MMRPSLIKPEDFQAAMGAIADWDQEIGLGMQVEDADELATLILCALPSQKLDFNNFAEITRSMEACDDPVKVATAVIGLAAGLIEHHRGVAVAKQILTASANSLAV